MGSPVTSSPEGSCARPHAILRLPAVQTRTGLSRSTIYLRVTQGSFPSPISLGRRAVGWVEQDVQSWLAERIAASRLADR